MVRPAILCGLDFLALGFARGLLADRRLTTADKTGLRLFDFVTQSHADFRSVLDKLTAEAQDRGLEPTPHIVLLTSTFGENSTRVVDHLKEISRTLRLALPGNQQITLVGVMPRVANTERKIEMFRFFQQLEGFVSQIPFLSTIFLHELSADPGNQEGLTSETKPEVDLETCQDVQEFLFRELLEADFRGEIDRLGSSAVGSGITALGRLCCFSSLGAHVLWFPRERILDYLRTRFQCEVFDRGLADAGSLSEKELESVQNRVDALIKALVAKLDQEISAGGQISVRASDLEHLDQLDRWETELVNEISKSAELAGSRGASTRTLSKERIRSDFLDFFHQAPRYLAGMQSYVDALGGRRLTASENEDDPPSGIQMLEQLLTRTPGLSALLSIFTPVALRALEELGAPAPARDEAKEPSQWLASVLDSAQQESAGKPPEVASWIRFLARAYGTTRNHLMSGAGGAEFAAALTAVFQEESSALLRIVEEIHRARQAVEESRDDLSREFSFLRRLTKGKEHQQRRLDQETKSTQLEAHRAAVRRVHGRIFQFFLRVVDAVVLPYTVRREAAQQARIVAESVAKELGQFLGRVRVVFQGRLGNVSVPPHRTAIESTIGGAQELDAIHTWVVGDKTMRQFAKEVLELNPARRPASSPGPASYEQCESLREHFEIGSQTLIDRITDFSQILFEPVGRLDVVDVIEICKGDESASFLSGCLARTASPLTFSPGLVPVAEEKRRIGRIHMIRSGSAVCLKVESRYPHLFRWERRLIDNGDPCRLDMSCLVFGFPAFVLHLLKECRELCKDTGFLEGGDLWPEPIPGLRSGRPPFDT